LTRVSARRTGIARALMDSPLFLLSALIIAYIADLVGLVPWGCLIVAAWLASGRWCSSAELRTRSLAAVKTSGAPALMNNGASALRGRR
jgi:hypothetical protein